MNAAASPRVGMFPPLDLLSWDPAMARAFLAGIGEAGIDHVCCGDHVSFVAGLGFDGLMQATALAALGPSLRISCGLYLLPLRHPVLVARQLADFERFAPGRLTFGVGIGGEDRHEVEICGVDPATRGARMDECLTVLRELLTGQAVTFHGRFFDLDEAMITPPAPGIPILVGGRSDAAVRRAGRHGDGWLGIWNSPRRFAAAVELAAGEAVRAGRPGPPARHAMQVWCGFADTREAARASLAPAMEAFYGLPFERFERYCPYGTADDVAGFLVPYVAAGCSEFNLIPQAPAADQAVAGVAAVRNLLAGTRVPSAWPHWVLPH
jgi:alkanesulfonate monooxygenase SsuD/methylene tetrahydromethanopterin reductase-like flavin-dependent oxidoreductase (luciferase family)